MKEILITLAVVIVALVLGKLIKWFLEKRIEGKQVDNLDNGIIYFYSPRCGVCRSIEEEVEKLKDEVNLVKINVEEKPEIAKKFGVLGVPAFLIVEEGRVKKAFLGTKGLSYIKKLAGGKEI